MSDNTYGLEKLGLRTTQPVHYNLPAATLVEHALARGEGCLAANGALTVDTGKYTGRSPNDKFLVDEPETTGDVWWGKVNQPVTPDAFDNIHRKLIEHLNGQELYIFDGYVGADERYRRSVRVVSQKAWHSLFARTLFRRLAPGETLPEQPELTVLDGCEFQADPDQDATRSEAFIFAHLTRKLVLIGGTHYGGEIKKSIFSLMNFFMPQQGVFPMHCSANVGPDEDAALFFGLSGTGKTTLSADPQRALIGDDEHGWSDHGIFNFEGGCYAKTIRLSRAGEPQIWDAIRFGSVLENVVLEPGTRVPDYDDGSLTENTRATYPVEHIPGCLLEGMGPQPRNVIFLTCDAFGILPPISKLTPEQATYHFLSGYTAKVAGTERGVTEPTATFSACFGAPFLPQHPTVYGTMLTDRLKKSGANVWLVNTGWNGTGERVKLEYTRAMVAAALSGALDGVVYRPDPIFQVQVPQSVPGVPPELLNAVDTWPDKDAYRAKAKHLAALFQKNFATVGEGASAEVAGAGPQVT